MTNTHTLINYVDKKRVSKRTQNGNCGNIYWPEECPLGAEEQLKIL